MTVRRIASRALAGVPVVLVGGTLLFAAGPAAAAPPASGAPAAGPSAASTSAASSAPAEPSKAEPTVTERTEAALSTAEVAKAEAPTAWPRKAPPAGAAPAEDRGPKDDATYGRIEGDVSLVLGVGPTLAPGGVRGTLDARVRYLDSIGIFGAYEDGPLLSSKAEPQRVVVAGLEVRPLFLGRWLTGRELGVARLDLLIDSLGFEIGAFFGQPTGTSFASRPGVQLGLGLEAPIFSTASGPWIGLHGGFRWSDAAATYGASAAEDRSAYLSITVAWHQIIGTKVTSLGTGR